MINLSFDELRSIAQDRNISSFENRSKEDSIKALSEPKSESPKPEIPKPETPKPKITNPETPKLIQPKLKISKLKIPKPKPRPEIRVNKKKLKTLRKEFDELRHKFDKQEIDRYRNGFYDVEDYENLSVSKIKMASKSLTKLKICLGCWNFVAILIVLNMKILTTMIIVLILLMTKDIEKLEVLEHYFKNQIEIISNQ